MTCAYCLREGERGWVGYGDRVVCAVPDACKRRARRRARGDPEGMVRGRLVELAYLEPTARGDVLVLLLSEGLVAIASGSSGFNSDAEVTWRVEVSPDWPRPAPPLTVVAGG